MKLVSIAVALFFGMHCAHAAIIDQIDDLNIRKIEAEDGVKTIKAHFLPTPFQVRSATVQHRRHGGVNGRGKGRGQGL